MAQTPAPHPDAGNPIAYDPDFNGPLKHRSCTDVLCLLVFFIFLGCWLGVGIFAYTKGDTELLLIPRDSNGSRCGFDRHVRNKPYLFFFDITKCLGPNVPFTGCNTPQVCVRECPRDTFIWARDKDVSRLICLGDQPRGLDEAQRAVDAGQCAKWFVPSEEVVKRCFPRLPSEKDLEELNRFPSILNVRMKKESFIESIKNLKIIEQSQQFGHEFVQDLRKAWPEMIGFLILSIVTCMIYIFIMRWIAKVMVWLTILGLLALLSFCTYITAMNYSYYKAHPYEQENARNLFEKYVKTKEFWLTLLIISAIILGLLLFILIFIRKQIILAIALIKEGSKAVSAVTSALFFPVIPWLLQMAVVAFAISVGLYLSTVGTPRYEVRNFSSSCGCTGPASAYKDGAICDIDTMERYCPGCPANCRFIEVANTKLVTYLQVFNVFGFFWGVFFIIALGEMILAATFATWYWTFKKSNVPFFTVTSAAYRTLRYHIGTLAFGSLIIAICRMIRVMLEYVDAKLKKYDNELVKAILCCCKCFFWCLEKFLKFINKNAYIMCAIHGKNFCASAKDAFSLLVRNIIRVAVLDKVTDFLFFLSKLLVSLGVASIVYSYLEFVSTKKLHYAIGPTVIIFICSYLIASMFFSVYTMAVDTLFMCFLEDCERNDGSEQRPYYMSKNLRKIFGKQNKGSAI